MNHDIHIRGLIETTYSSRRQGFSLLELIVVVAILGRIAALLLPAIQAARESARRTECQNNLKSIVHALLHHHTSMKSFPSGGWGNRWVGVPGRGSAKRQPGGWIYSILPFIEQTPLHELGGEATGVTADNLYSARLKTAVSEFNCPSRRASEPLPISDLFPYAKMPRPYGKVDQVARADYAINAGVSRIFSPPGPNSLEEGDNESYWNNRANSSGSEGISYQRQGISLDSVTDGTIHTYAAGEKHVYSQNYSNGASPGDNESMYGGYGSDLHRVAGIIERIDLGKSPFVVPLPDHLLGEGDIPDFFRFGSAHAAGVYMAYCSGSVRLVSFDVDGEIHFRSAHRRDRDRPIAALR